MPQQKPDSNRAAAIFIGSLLAVAINAYLIGRYATWQLPWHDAFSGFYLLLGFASGFVISLGVAFFILKERFRERLLEEAIFDRTTGLYSRLYMNEVAPKLVQLHQRNPQAGFSVAMLEIAGFPNLQKQRGKKFATQAKAALGTRLMEIVRETDLAVQYDQEHVLLFCAHDDQKGQRGMIQRLADQFADFSVSDAKGKILLKINMAVVPHELGESLSDLLHRLESEMPVPDQATGM